MSHYLGTTLKARLLKKNGLLVPGAANALAARVIHALGYEAIYLSGAGLTNTCKLIGEPGQLVALGVTV